MNENNLTISITLPIPIKLVIFIDWISPSKHLPTKLFFAFLTSLFSLLFLFYLYMLFISYHNNNIYSFSPSYITKPIFLKFNLFPSSHLFTYIQDINPEFMAVNTPNTKSTSINPPFQISYITLMPYFGASNGLFFEEANVSKF